MGKRICLSGIFLLSVAFCIAQQLDSTIDGISQLPNRFFYRIKNKTDKLDDRLTHQTEKYLARLARKEQKIQRKLYAKDSVAAKNLFSGSQEKYAALQQQIRDPQINNDPLHPGEYMPNVDSLKVSLGFLKQNQDLLNTSASVQNKIGGSLGSLTQLQSKLQASEQAREFIRQRKQQLRDALSRYEKSLGFDKYVDDYNKQLYYYTQQLREYKQALNDPDKLQEKVLVLLNKLPAFQDFMQRNSQLAMLFNLPANYGTTAALNGLQSREQIQQILQREVSAAGSNGMATMQSNLESAHAQLNQLKDKLSKLGEGGGDVDMPNFKPNDQKTKSFLNRLEFGTNIQTLRSTYFFPTTTDIGLSLGYKLSGKGTAGIGASYKMGWGTGFNHIALSGQGISLRSFIDVRLKGSFYISGGYEENYQKPFNNFQQIRDLSIWQHSGLIGISKMVSLSGKLIKKTKVQLLWDFLSYYQLPRTQAVKFRVGYNF